MRNEGQQPSIGAGQVLDINGVCGRGKIALPTDPLVISLKGKVLEDNRTIMGNKGFPHGRLEWLQNSFCSSNFDLGELDPAWNGQQGLHHDTAFGINNMRDLEMSGFNFTR